MTKRIFYEKISTEHGDEYRAVSEYDRDLIDSFKNGTHLIMCHPGGQTRRYNIDPNYAAMIAAGRICEDVISKAIMAAHEIRPYQNTALDNEQFEAWENLKNVLGDRGRYIEWPSAREVTEKAVQAMIDEAAKILENPSVKQAYDHFMMVAALTKDYHSD